MPLVLNLHHEVEKRRAIKRRDPLKFAIGGIAAIVLGFAGYYFYQLEVAHSLAGQLTTREMELKQIEPKADAAKKREDELNVTIKAGENMVKRVEGRFYWAPVLTMLSQVVPKEVQVTKLSGDVNGEQIKHCNITLEGIAAGAEPRKVAEELRKAMTERFAAKYKGVVSSFKSLEDSNEVVKVNGAPAKTADFTINIELQFGEESTPAPVYKGHHPSA